MTVRFILGRAGSGKTRFCLKSIINEEKDAPLGPPLILLVPEQATFLMEKELLKHNRGATSRIRLTSFGRLSYSFASREVQALPLLTETGRQMVLRLLLQRRSKSLQAFARAPRQPKFCEKLSGQVKEFKNYLVTPEALWHDAENESLPPPLRGKLADLAIILDDYLEFVSGRYHDPEDSLTMLASALEAGGLPPGSKVWVDGFAGFTAQEYGVISALFKRAKHVELALCLDPTQAADNFSENELFYPTLDTYRRLRQLAGRTETAALPPLVLPQGKKLPRFVSSPGLAHLESELFALPRRVYKKEIKNMMLVSAANRRAEVEAAARDILHKARDNGWRFSQMAVVVRELQPYQDLITAVFTKYGIPFFTDSRRPVAHHPLVEMMRSALSAVLGNFKSEDVCHMLKTDLFTLSRDAVDRLENYVLAHGIRGQHWIAEDPWTWHQQLTLDDTSEYQHGYDMGSINNARDCFRRIFTPFYRKVTAKKKQQAAAYCLALWQLLESVQAQGTLQRWAKEERERGNLEQAALHRKVWMDVTSLLEQLYAILGDTEISPAEFSEILQSGLEAITAGLVPALLDQVVIGAVERSRQSELKAVYVLGLCDGEFPARLPDDGLFSDGERSQLAAGGTEMSQPRRQRLFNEQYLAYIALTRASHFLFAAYPLAGEDGKAKRPSPVFNKLCDTFPENSIEYFGLIPAAGQEMVFLAGGKNAAGTLLLNLAWAGNSGVQREFWCAAVEEAMRVPDICVRLQQLMPALSYKNLSAVISRNTTARLYGLPLATSISRLELYARCPFAHFARYGLRLSERKVFSVDAPDLGNFYHAALRQFVEELLADDVSWQEMKQKDAVSRMEAVVDRLVPRLHGEILLSSGRHRYLALKLKENLVRAAKILTLHARSSEFRPVHIELPFVLEYVMDHAQEKETAGRLSLAGRIDRVDEAHDAGGKKYVRVIDYKSSVTSLDLSDAWHGLSLQLLSYLDAAMKHSSAGRDEPRTAGAFYFTVDKPFRRLPNPPAEDKETADMRLDGLVVADKKALQLLGGEALVPASLKKDGSFSKKSHVATALQFKALRHLVAGKVGELGKCVLAGRTDIRPYRKENGEKACSFCCYSPLCRFDAAADGSSYRHLRTYSRQEILETHGPGKEGQS